MFVLWNRKSSGMPFLLSQGSQSGMMNSMHYPDKRTNENHTTWNFVNQIGRLFRQVKLVFVYGLRYAYEVIRTQIKVVMI